MLIECLLGLIPLLEEIGPTCPIYCVPQKIMDNIASFHVYRGILSLGKRKILSPLQNLPEKALILILYEIFYQDDMGAIFRNATTFS